MGGGHSVAYEIVRGKPVIFDTQSGKKFKTAADWNKAFNLESEQWHSQGLTISNSMKNGWKDGCRIVIDIMDASGVVNANFLILRFRSPLSIGTVHILGRP